MRYGFYEFFAGAGLARLGLGESWKCLWANDIDVSKGEVYTDNFGSDHLKVGDVAMVKASELPGKAMMAWASFPCQDLSLAGWRKGMSAHRSGTFWGFWSLMENLFKEGRRPPIIVLENVLGLLSSDDFIGLCEAMVALGMQMGTLVVDARHFVPQSRPRLFVVAIDEHIDASEFHTLLHGEAPWFPERLLYAQAALPEEVKEKWRWWKLPVPSAPLPKVEDLIDTDPEGVKWYADAETKNLIGMMNKRHLEKLKELQDDPERRVGFVYRRTRQGKQRAELRIDGLAGCLRTPTGGSSRQIVVECHNGKTRARLLSTREAARLMGCPDSYVLPDNYNAGYYAMGDAVAVPVVSWLSEHLLIPMAQKASDYLRKKNKKSSRAYYHSVSQSSVAQRVYAMACAWKGAE